jgi:uncharacterized membrane protein YphA (DoxX/SURF4 family)
LVACSLEWPWPFNLVHVPVPSLIVQPLVENADGSTFLGSLFLLILGAGRWSVDARIAEATAHTRDRVSR